MNTDYLIQKFQEPLVKLLRFSLVRKFIGVDYMLPKGKQVVGVHPSGISYLDYTKGKKIYITSKFQQRPIIAEKLQILFKLLALAPIAATHPGLVALGVDTFVSNAADDSIYNQATDTYANVRSATAGSNDRGASADNFYIQNGNLGGGQYNIERAFFYFATGATIPAGDTITAASLALVTKNDVTVTDGYTATLVATTPADPANIVLGDFDQVGSTSFGEGTIPATNTGFTITINATGMAAITKGSGNTVWGLRMSGDVANSSPSSFNQANIRSADHATSSDRPTLSVTHVAPSSGAVIII